MYHKSKKRYSFSNVVKIKISILNKAFNLTIFSLLPDYNFIYAINKNNLNLE